MGQVIRTVTLEAPRKGLVVVNVSANTFTLSAAASYLQCSITQGTSLGNIKMQEGYITTPPNHWNPWGMTRAFPVDAGSQTFNLCCAGSTGMNVQDAIMNAVFHSVPSIVVPAPALLAPEQANISGCDESDVSCN